MSNRTTSTTSIQGFLRLPQVLELIPVGKSTWWQWCAEGKAPKPIKLSQKVTVWKAEDIESFLKQVQN